MKCSQQKTNFFFFFGGEGAMYKVIWTRSNQARLKIVIKLVLSIYLRAYFQLLKVSPLNN